jgi:hypothetical protein
MASVSCEELPKKPAMGLLTGGGRRCFSWLVLRACGVPMKYESNTFHFIFQSVSQTNMVNLNSPPLKEHDLFSLYLPCTLN